MFQQPPWQVVQFGSLPDIGIFLRAVLQRRFFSPALNKHNAKMDTFTLDIGVSPHETRCHVDAIGNHVCAVILQVIFLVFYLSIFLVFNLSIFLVNCELISQKITGQHPLPEAE